LGRAEDAAHAAAFVKTMYDENSSRFSSGCAPDGTINHLLAADAGIWPYLAGLGDAASALLAINALRHGNGIGFSAASTGIWLEGTAFAALALRKMGNPLADAFMATIAANISSEGYVYATVTPSLSTGLTVGPSLQKNMPELAFNYYRRPSLSATCWAGLVELGANPLAPAGG
jgi:ABC-type thiamin/hydroxymethylpyrimidine transport system permease subunit